MSRVQRQVAAAFDLLAVARELPPADRVATRTALTVATAAAEESGGPPAVVAVLKSLVLLLWAVDEADAEAFRDALDRGVPGHLMHDRPKDGTDDDQ